MATPTATAAHILVQTEQECLTLKAEIESGANFEELARKHSKCPSGQRGGALGTFRQGQMVPEFDAIVFNGELKKVLGPVKTQFGYHLIWIEQRS